ncbi:MAG TPA: amidohydrolase family protein [Terriglobales bacterium]|nr:amidohydrolase family protein [Terriglobales bacterium]
MKSAVLVSFLVLAIAARAQLAPDPELTRQIFQIRAIDNHSHPPRLLAAGEKDDEHDALPCGPLEHAPDPVKLRPDNPQFIAAWKALWKYPYNDAAPEHVKAVVATKERIKREQGDHYSAWVLDQLGIETELANRVAMGRGLVAPRFLWVPFDDALLFPFNTASMETTPDRKFFYSRETQLLKRYMSDLKLSGLPATLEEYLARVVTPTLERQKNQRAVAIKFEAAYLRSLDFAPASAADASTVYSHFVHGSTPNVAEYKLLQDYIFRHIAREAGRLGMAVHFHTGVGCGSYFELSGANPLLLQSVMDDPALRKTIFVLVHGGWPFTKEVAYLFTKPNVYADYSEQTWLLSSRELAGTLRTWLEWYPERVMFGTDLYPDTPEIDWEEVGWMTTHDAREALALALTGMMNDGLISRQRATEIAHMVLHDNAARLYGLAGR